MLEQVLSGEATEICVQKVHDYLTETNEKVRDGKVNLEDFIINKVRLALPFFLSFANLSFY